MLRLSRIEGQIRGLRSMIEEDRYCLDEIQQITATTAALREVALMIIAEHVTVGAEIATEPGANKEMASLVDDLHDRFLKISGEVEITDANERPHLTMSDPPSSDLSVLSLDLVVSVDGDSVPGSRWASCTLQNRTFPGAYAAVRVMWQGVEVASLPL
ncbi:metal-sensitive transcriptional regulator [Methylobacterium sp. WL64]|uniref:metal-sensitive transcriptional regulator n=1 Tax=Methylobacterium sp. WL64 TaxID=2603894 RepID=UPI001FEE1353|nr:metal-sensitive transcriptional regulator [Methylobacterium sp. WL64]